MLAINFRRYLCRLLVLNVFAGFSVVSSAHNYKYRVMGVDEFTANKSNQSLNAAGKPKESFTYEAYLYPNTEDTRKAFGSKFGISALATSASNEQVIEVSNKMGAWNAHVVDNEIKSMDRYSTNDYPSIYEKEKESFYPTARKLILDVYKQCHSSYAQMKGEGYEKGVNVMYEFD